MKDKKTTELNWSREQRVVKKNIKNEERGNLAMDKDLNKDYGWTEVVTKRDRTGNKVEHIMKRRAAPQKHIRIGTVW